ncbi:hypothetical protein [Rhizosphaericola mali]|uniref:Uncharacterized protein n=1 Tax=Rhizosphaericola mali TaxID=2545455 RepID=A0A5P2G4F4_9BACT|nr:hypothetical protein [Rhizosphaericola mali]QES87973.1 hypothetical protein E0W69_004595 [Rhizosphaericola mali]
MNTKLLALLIFSFILNSLLAQRRVESIKDDKTAIKFIKNYFYDDYNYDWNKFHLIKGDEWTGLFNISKHLEDSLIANQKYLGWVKLDMNEDKKEDLIVSGYFSDKDIPEPEFGLFVFLSRKDGYYDVHDLKFSDQKTYPLYISETIFMDNKIPMIRLIDWAPDAMKLNNLPFAVDTVFHFDKYFINYNSHPLANWVQSVQMDIKNQEGIHTKLSITDMDSVSIGKINLEYLRGNKWNKIIGKLYPDIYIGLDQLINYGLTTSDFAINVTGNYMDENYLSIKFLNGKAVSLSNFTTRNRYTFDAICSWLIELNGYVHYLHEQKENNKNKN